MKSNQLTKSEYKHRVKFIQEHHYNKSEQRILDEAKHSLNMSYKELYWDMRRGIVYAFMSTISMRRISRALYYCGVSAKQAAESFANFNGAISNTEEVISGCATPKMQSEST